MIKKLFLITIILFSQVVFAEDFKYPPKFDEVLSQLNSKDTINIFLPKETYLHFIINDEKINYKDYYKRTVDNQVKMDVIYRIFVQKRKKSEENKIDEMETNDLPAPTDIVNIKKQENGSVISFDMRNQSFQKIKYKYPYVASDLKYVLEYSYGNNQVYQIKYRIRVNNSIDIKIINQEVESWLLKKGYEEKSEFFKFHLPSYREFENKEYVIVIQRNPYESPYSSYYDIEFYKKDIYENLNEIMKKIEWNEARKNYKELFDDNN